MNEIISQLQRDFRLFDSSDESVKSFNPFEQPGKYPNIDLFLGDMEDICVEISMIIFIGTRMEYVQKNQITNEWG